MKLAVVGTSSITEVLLQSVQTFKRFSPYGILSRSKEKAEHFQKQFDILYYFSTIEELASSDVDAVYIASPNSLHYEQAQALLSAKKHVLLEKPFTSTVLEAKQLMSTATDNRLTLMEAMKTTFLPNFIELEKHVSKLKKINSVEISFCKLSSRYNDFLEGKMSNMFSSEMGGGSLVDVGVYAVWAAISLFGTPKSWTHKAQVLSSGVDSKGELVLEYEDFSVPIFHSKMDDRGCYIRINGDKNIFVEEFIDIKGFFVDDAYTSVEQEYEPMYYELSEFYDLISSNKLEASINSWKKTLLVMNILEDSRKQANIIYPTA